MIRRNLLKALPVGALTALAGCAPIGRKTSELTRLEADGSGDEVAGRRLTEFGLQLSTITPLLMADFEGTLAAVAGIGYKQVEFSALGFLGRPVSLVAELLDANGLTAPVGRISPKLPDGFAGLTAGEQMAAFREHAGPDYLLDNIRWGLEGAAALGQKHLVLPALMPDNFATLKQLDQCIDLLRQAGELCAEAGVQFGYHNHDWEFREVEGTVPFDLMLERLDPELMSWQLDVYWVVKGGRDPLVYLVEQSGRVPTCHLKDIDKAGDFADVGSGTIDFPAFIGAAMNAGTQYYFVERDRPPQPMQTAQRAYAYLEQMTY